MFDGGLGRALKDGVPVSVDGEGQAIALGDVADQLKVASGVLLGAEERPHDLAGGIVDGAQEGQLRSPLLEPGMERGIQLQQAAGLRVALPALTAAPPPILLRTGQARTSPHPAHAGARDLNLVLLL